MSVHVPFTFTSLHVCHLQNGEAEDNGIDFSNVDSLYDELLDRLDAVDQAAPAAAVTGHGKHSKVKTGAPCFPKFGLLITHLHLRMPRCWEMRGRGFTVGGGLGVCSRGTWGDGGRDSGWVQVGLAGTFVVRCWACVCPLCCCE